jgi:PIN domain nuclease of toxin-antitoxin system
MEDSKNLSENIKIKIRNPESKIFVSVVTVWEIVIKRSLKKIKVSFDLKSSIKKAGFEVLPVQISHALRVEKLPIIHKDPFDRILISQAKVEYLTLITDDPKIKKYKIPTL